MTFGLFIILFVALCLFVWYLIYTPVVKWYDRKQAAKLKPYEPVHSKTVGKPKPITKTELDIMLRELRTRKPYDTQL